MIIWKKAGQHPTKTWHKWSVQRLINKEGTMERKKGLGRPRSVTTKENEEIVEQLIYSQKDAPRTHMSPRESRKTPELKDHLLLEW